MTGIKKIGFRNQSFCKIGSQRRIYGQSVPGEIERTRSKIYSVTKINNGGYGRFNQYRSLFDKLSKAGAS